MSLTAKRSTILCPAVLVALIGAAPSARADTKAECTASYEKGQVLRDEGKFVRAAEEFLACAREVCPVVLRKDCLEWRAQVEAGLPTIVVAARTPSGSDVVDVRVSVDGRVIATKLDGRAMFIDPGPHTLRFERPGAAAVEQSIVAREGEKMRSIQVIIGDAPAPVAASAAPRSTATAPAAPAPLPPQDAMPSSPSRVPTATWVASGIGVLALGSFAAFGVAGRSSQSRLEACRPGCSPDDVSAVRTKYIVADVSLGVAIVSFAVGAYFLFTQPTTASAPATAARGPLAP